MPTIGKYEILEQLGSGSMGTVYKGRDTLLDRMVAIKTIRAGVNVELEAKERFYREARTCARLNHPHIVAVFDLGEENGTSFIAMELLNGSDFRQLIERREAIALPTKLTAMAQICEALAYAHRAGVIHRDIKPSNLFLPVDLRAKVVDFGIAKLPTSHLTRAGSILGTPNYMAPEQIKGSPCDGRADLFSAAIVFFEFLTFNHPFKSNLAAGSNLTPRMEIPRRIMEEKPDSLLQQDPSLPVILEKIFTKALAKDPADRYATGDDFAADLRAVTDALTQNSSPTFSAVELPSLNSFAVPPPIPVTESMPPRPIGLTKPDNQEWRVTRMLKLNSSFEGYLSAKDLQSARNGLTEMLSVAGDDPRYKDAVESCRLRLAQLEQAQTAEAVGKARCNKCANMNRADAVFCVGCGAPLTQGASTGAAVTKSITPPPPPPTTSAQPLSKTTSVPKPQSVPKSQSVPAALPTRAAQQGTQTAAQVATQASSQTANQQTPNQQTAKQQTANQQTAKQPAPPPKGKSDHTKLIAAIGIVAVAALLLIVAPVFFRSVKQEAFVATAVVEAQDARVLATANDDAKVVTALERGAQVNVLSLPISLKQGWARVQARSGSKYSEAGFLKVASMSDWDSKDANAALALARMSGPMETGSHSEMQTQVEKLKAVASAFPGKPVAGLAALDAARLEFLMAKNAKEADAASTGWQTSLTDLKGRLETLRSDSALQSGSDDLLKQISELMPSSTAEPTPAPPPLVPGATTSTSGEPSPVPTDADIQKYMSTAQRLLDQFRYDEALFQVRRVLKAQPQNSDAKALQKKIADQKKLEGQL